MIKNLCPILTKDIMVQECVKYQCAWWIGGQVQKCAIATIAIALAEYMPEIKK